MLRIGFRQPDRQHSSGAIGEGLQAAAVMTHQQRIAQRQHTADIGRGHLTDAVPDDRRRLDTQIGELGGQTHLQQKIGGLGELGSVDA